jgi:hypothetical protein
MKKKKKIPPSLSPPFSRGVHVRPIKVQIQLRDGNELRISERRRGRKSAIALK